MMEEYSMDLTYCFNHHPIVSYFDNETFLSDEEVTERCKNLNLSIDKIFAVMPENLRIKHITGHHTGQCSLEDFFRSYNFDDEIIGFGDSGIALLIRKEGQYSAWVEFNFSKMSKEGAIVFKELINHLQKVTETRLAISIIEGKGYKVIPLDSVCTD